MVGAFFNKKTNFLKSLGKKDLIFKNVPTKFSFLVKFIYLCFEFCEALSTDIQEAILLRHGYRHTEIL